MALTPAQLVFQQTGARATSVLVFHPTDPVADGIEVRQSVADQNFDTDPTDLVPGLSPKAVISKTGGVTLKESLTQSGQLTGPSKFATGRVVLDADDEIAQDWIGYDWNAKPFEWYLGATRDETGAPMPLSDFDLITGITDEIRAIGDGQVEITFADVRLKLQDQFVTETYKGLGGAFPIRTEPGSGTYLDQDHDVSMDINGAMTIEWFGAIEKLNANTNGAFDVYTPILMSGRNGQAGAEELNVNYALLINDQSGVYSFAGGVDGGGASTVVDSTYAIVLGEPTYFSVTVAANGTDLTFTACRLDDQSPVEVGTATLPDAIESGPTDGFQVGMSEGSHFVNYETRLWDVERTLLELQEFFTGTIANAGDFPGLLEMWRYTEGQELGTAAEKVFGKKSVIDLRPVGDPPIWESSYTGDEPDRFPGGVAGLSKPRTFGAVSNIQLARVDTQHHVFGWDSVPSNDVVQLRVKGVPMVMANEITSVAPGDFVFDAAANTVTLTDGALGTFSKFIPGQVKPSRPGQRIEILNATNPENTGIFRVASTGQLAGTELTGISDDGLVMTIADRLVVNESAPAGTVVKSYEPDVQYEVDLVRSVVIITALRANSTAPIFDLGDVTADVVGRLPVSGFARWVDLFELVSGVTPDATDVTFDPELDFHIAAGESMTTNQVLDEMAMSSVGRWIEDGAGGYRLGTFTPPIGLPVEVLDGPEIGDIDPLKSFETFHKFKIGHSHIWHPQVADRLASSVSQGDVQRFGQEYTYEPSSDPAVLVTYPAATEHEPFEHWLSLPADAVLAKALTKSLISKRRKRYRLEFHSFWPKSVLLNDVLHVTWDDLSLGLITTPVKVISRELDTGSYTITLEVFS